MREPVKTLLSEAVAIGKLMNDPGKTIGWVYLWDTSDLSILWLTDDRSAISIHWSREWHKQALPQTSTNDPVIDFLKTLSPIGEDDPS